MQAKAFEIRYNMNLVRLLISRGKQGESRMMLAETCNRAAEAFDSAEFKDTRALFEKLGV